MGARTVNATVAILVCFANHLVDLVVGELLANRCHDVAEFSCGDEAIVVAIEHLIECGVRGCQRFLRCDRDGIP